MPAWRPVIMSAAARSKLPIQPMRSIHDSQCWRIVSAFSRCMLPHRPPVIRISSTPSGRQTEVDGRTGPPFLADDIEYLGSLSDEDGNAVSGQRNPDDAPA